MCKSKLTFYYKYFLVFLFIAYVTLIPIVGSPMLHKTKSYYLFPLLFIFHDNLFFEQNYWISKSNYYRSIRYFFFFAISTIVVVSKIDLALTQVVNFFLFFIFFTPFITLFNNIRNANTILITTLFITLAISILLATFQFLGFEQFYIYSYEKLNGNVGLDSNNFRSFGTWGNSLSFSNYLSVIATIIIVYFFEKNEKGDGIFKFIALWTFLISLWGLLISQGRTATVTFIIVNLIVFFIYQGKIFFFVFVLLVALITSLYINDLDFLLDRYFNSGDDFEVGRYDNWLRGISIFWENPLFGTGIGNLNNRIYYKYEANSFDSGAAVFVNGHVESVYFSILATYGSIGFILFMNFIIRLTKYLFNCFRTNSFVRPFTFAWVVFLINMITNPGIIVDYRLTMFFLIFLTIPLLKSKFDN